MKIRKLNQILDQQIIENAIDKNTHNIFFLEYTNQNLIQKKIKKLFIKKNIKKYLMFNITLKLNLFLNKFDTLELFLRASEEIKTRLVYSRIMNIHFNGLLILKKFKKNLTIKHKYFILLLNKITLIK
jgi:hypothetical protein